MEIKVGDIVKIREDLVVDENYLKHDKLCVMPGMVKYKGEFAVVTYVDYSDNTLMLDVSGHFWKFDMFQTLEEAEHEEVSKIIEERIKMTLGIQMKK